MLKFREYVCPDTLEEAYEQLKRKRSVILGGMLWLKMQNGNASVAIDLSKLGLDKITEEEECISIGAYVSLREIETSELLRKYYGDTISKAVEHLIGVQFRNCATVGGSVFGRFGFSDVLTVFMAIGAKVELYKNGVMAIEDFAALPHSFKDILVRVIVPKNVTASEYKSTRNSATDFPSLTCAIAVVDGNVRCAIGARPMKAILVGDDNEILAEGINNETAERFGEYVADTVSFDSNRIASAEYRHTVCKVIVRRCLLELEEGSKDGN